MWTSWLLSVALEVRGKPHLQATHKNLFAMHLWPTSPHLAQCFASIYSQKGHRSDLNNYRTISVQDPFVKVFSSILNHRLNLYVQENSLLQESQFGFAKGKGTIGATTLLREIAFSRLESKQRTYVAFIDYEKTFDWIDRDKLICHLLDLGIPLTFARVLYNILEGTQISIKLGERRSHPFKSKNGLLQGIHALQFFLIYL